MNLQINWAHWIAGQVHVIPCSEGDPGTAKTDSHKAFARAVARKYRAYILGNQVPEDLGGFKAVRQAEYNGHVYDVMRSIYDERLITALLYPTVIHVDELSNVPHSTQAAALGFMQGGINDILDAIEGMGDVFKEGLDRKVPDALIFASCNPITSAAAGVEFTPPMINRMCYLKWEFDEQAWSHGVRNRLNFPAPNFPIVPADWVEYMDHWGPMVDLFRKSHHECMQAYPMDPDKASQPWPSWRSWTNVIKCLAGAQSVNASRDTMSKLVYGCVGDAAGSQFLTWLSQQNLPDPEDILRDPGSLKLPVRGDMAIAILANVIHAVKVNNSPDRWEAARHVLEVAHDQNEELAAAAEGKLWRFKPAEYSPVVRTTAAAKAMAKNRLASAR